MKKIEIPLIAIALALAVFPASVFAQDRSPAMTPTTSVATDDCLACHASLHPGIVEAWKSSRHAKISPARGRLGKSLKRRMSRTELLPEALENHVVGCAECHTMRPGEHGKGTYEHNGYQVHTVVSPDDCSTCHPVEREQYSKNMMSHARGILTKNSLYQDLIRTISGTPQAGKNGAVTFAKVDEATNAESCFYCHGTELKVTGTERRETDFGDFEFPKMDGWPNGGVGRINLDDSQGSCTACHTSHLFDIETARKPYTCKECHVGPDVPVYKIYSASKHGKIYESHKHEWNFENVPWTAGKDFTAPTCASCHVSLVVNTDGGVISERTHQMNDRLPWRQFGLIYAHSHPKAPDTSIIRNKDGQQLPTAFDGTPASDFLISARERDERKQTLLKVCTTCHGSSFIQGFWARFENTLEATNQATLTATKLMQAAWAEGHAKGPAQGGSAFDEFPEKIWSDLWLFYANSTRMASSMAGGGDYATFADGRYQLARGVTELADWLKVRRMLVKGKK